MVTLEICLPSLTSVISSYIKTISAVLFYHSEFHHVLVIEFIGRIALGFLISPFSFLATFSSSLFV